MDDDDDDDFPAALFVSRQLIRFLVSNGVTGLKKNFSLRKKFC